MRRATQAALVLALAVLALRLALTDDLLAFVKPQMRWPLVASGLVLAALGVATLWRGDPDEVDHPQHEPGAGAHDEHGHDHAGGRLAWLLLLPVVGVLLVPPTPLGAFMADRGSDLDPAAPLDAFGPLPEPVDGAVELALSEVVSRALYDRSGALRDVPLRLTGFVVTDGAPPDGVVLARFVVACCAADARPVRVVVEGTGGGFADDEWLTVVARWDGRAEPGEEVRLVAERVERIPVPELPYE